MHDASRFHGSWKIRLTQTLIHASAYALSESHVMYMRLLRLHEPYVNAYLVSDLNALSLDGLVDDFCPCPH